MSIVPKKSVKAANLAKRPSTIRRHSAPTIYDQYPKGTPCIVGPEESAVLFIQNSNDENNPCWVMMGMYIQSQEM